MSDRGRIVDPLGQIRDLERQRLGVPDARGVAAKVEDVARFGGRGAVRVQGIGRDAPVAGADQTISTTGYSIITGTEFDLSLGGPASMTWWVLLAGRVTFTAFVAVDDDVWTTVLVSRDGGATWKEPVVDVSAASPFISALALNHFTEAVGTALSQSAIVGAVMRMSPTETVRVALATKVGATTQGATVELTIAELTPRVVGLAIGIEGA